MPVPGVAGAASGARIVPGDVIRHEEVSANLLDSVISLVANVRSSALNRIIIYHLDGNTFCSLHPSPNHSSPNHSSARVPQNSSATSTSPNYFSARVPQNSLRDLGVLCARYKKTSARALQNSSASSTSPNYFSARVPQNSSASSAYSARDKKNSLRASPTELLRELPSSKFFLRKSSTELCLSLKKVDS